MPGGVDARDAGGRGGGPVPEKNYSFVHADVAFIETLFAEADAEAERGQWESAVRALQRVMDVRQEKDDPASAAPYVRAVHGSRTFEGAAIVARHRIARWGPQAMEAYESAFGGAARDALRQAAVQESRDAFGARVSQWLLCHAGRAAALLLVDRALEAGDPDRALRWLEALEDLEEVAPAEDPHRLRWRGPRLDRHARALAASPDVIAQVREVLAQERPLPADALAPELRRPQPQLDDWMTTGGDATRTGRIAPLGRNFTWRWTLSDVLTDTVEPSRDPDVRDSPSLFLPPRAVTHGDTIFLCDGDHVHAIRLNATRESERFQTIKLPGMYGVSNDTGEDARHRFGMIEGHALTFLSAARLGMRGEGGLLIVAAPAGLEFPISSDPDERRSERSDRLQCLLWDGGRLLPLWTATGVPPLRGDAEAALRGMPENMRLYGAPVFYRDKLWIGGVRPSASSADQWEAWLLALSPRTGRVLLRTHIGTGTPVRRSRIDELMPSAPAAGHGRVVVCTGAGMVAAVDASDGRIAWIHRYDRMTDALRDKRNANRPSSGLRHTGFSNEPPVLGLDRVFAAPVDGEHVLWLTNRPRLGSRSMVTERLGREVGGVANMSIESVIGVAGSPASLVLTGRGQEENGIPGPIVSVWDPLRRIERWRETGSTRDGIEIYGRGLVTDDLVYISTPGGIALYDLATGADAGTLDIEDVPENARRPGMVVSGNLIPVPGRGLLAVSATSITFWGSKR